MVGAAQIVGLILDCCPLPGMATWLHVFDLTCFLHEITKSYAGEVLLHHTMLKRSSFAIDNCAIYRWLYET